MTRNAYSWAVTSPSPCSLRGRLGALLQRRRGENRVGPILQPLLLVGHLVEVELGVLELRAPEQRVERTHLDADAAVHAQGVVDREAIEHLHRPRASATRRIVGLLVRV